MEKAAGTLSDDPKKAFPNSKYLVLLHLPEAMPRVGPVRPLPGQAGFSPHGTQEELGVVELA